MSSNLRTDYDSKQFTISAHYKDTNQIHWQPHTSTLDGAIQIPPFSAGLDIEWRYDGAAKCTYTEPETIDTTISNSGLLTQEECVRMESDAD